MSEQDLPIKKASIKGIKDLVRNVCELEMELADLTGYERKINKIRAKYARKD